MKDDFELFVVQILKNEARGIFIDLPLELQIRLRTGTRKILSTSFLCLDPTYIPELIKWLKVETDKALSLDFAVLQKLNRI